MQGTRVRALVREDPTCRGAAYPVHHNYWILCSRAREPQLLSLCATTTEAREPRAPALQQEKLLQWEACTQQGRVAPPLPQLEKACGQQQRPNTAKNQSINQFKKIQ